MAYRRRMIRRVYRRRVRGLRTAGTYRLARRRAYRRMGGYRR